MESTKCVGPSYRGGDLRESLRRALERCGKLALWQTVDGPLCQECADAKEAAIQPGAPTIMAILLDLRAPLPAGEKRTYPKTPIQ